MPLQAGTTLGPYRIEAPLGAGGMGEVYLAADTRQDRAVAIKALPEHVAAAPDLKQRFVRPLTRRMPVAIILATLTAGTLALPVAAQESVPKTAADIEQFLLTAEIVDARPIGKGVTDSWRLTLSDGTTTHDAAFQSINQQKRVSGRRRLEQPFKDSYHFNIAAYRLAKLLGLDDMVPVSVERRWKGQSGALVWWVVGAWDETERKARRLFPPDAAAWSKQLYRMVVFAELIYDTDRNEGNILYTKDWRVWMIDFTRAFRVWHELPNPEALVAYDAGLAEKLNLLDEQELTAIARGRLTSAETRAILARRDLILQRFEELKARVPSEP